MKWTEYYTVDSHGVDFNGIARASTLMHFMQECAGAHLSACGSSGKALRDSGRAFLLSRFCAGFYEAIPAYTRVAVETWACESRGFSFNRCYRILSGDRVLAEATSVWALVSIEGRRPIRVSDFETDLGVEDILSLDMPARISLPKTEFMRLVDEHTVSYREIDENVHMNNTYYPDMLCDTLNMQGKRIYRLSLNYLNEAKHHDVLNVYASEGKEDVFFKSIRADGKTNIEAQITLGEI